MNFWFIKILTALTLLGANAALAAAEVASCPRLFATSATSASLVRGLNQMDLSSVNGPSREFLTRLIYLIDERRLLDPAVLLALADSPQPLNPFGQRSATVQSLPHQQAFAELLKEDLQWNKIQHAARELMKTASDTGKRTQTAQEKTEKVVIPIGIKSLPFKVEKFLRTTNNQILALTSSIEWAKNESSAKIRVYDFPSGNMVFETLFKGQTRLGDIDLIEQDGRALALTALPSSRDLVTLDLRSTEPVSRIGLGPEGPLTTPSNSAPASPRFIRASGTLAALTIDHNQVILHDPIKQTLLDKFALNETPDYEPLSVRTSDRLSSAAGNDFLAVAGQNGPTHLIDPTQKGSVEEIPAFILLDSFAFQGQPYLLGYDQSKAQTKKTTPLKVLNLKTRKTKSFRVASDGTLPWLMGTFEQNGTIYGLVASDADLTLVDLIKGRVLRKLSEAPIKNRVYLEWSGCRDQQVTFLHDGKPYVVAIMDDDEQGKADLIIIDAMTLTLVNQPLQLNDGVEGLLLVPGTEHAPQVLVNFTSQTSLLVSLTNRLTNTAE